MAEQLLGNDIYDKFQSGFRKNRSTETALLVKQHFDGSRLRWMHNPGTIRLSAAFNSVDHNILINRLHNLVVLAGAVLKWFTSYLSGF